MYHSKFTNAVLTLRSTRICLDKEARGVPHRAVKTIVVIALSTDQRTTKAFNMIGNATSSHPW